MKVTKEQWLSAKAEFEANPGMTLNDVARAIGVSKQLVSLHASVHGWNTKNRRYSRETDSDVTAYRQKMFDEIFILLAGKGIVRDRIRRLYDILGKDYSYYTIRSAMSGRSTMTMKMYTAAVTKISNLPDYERVSWK